MLVSNISVDSLRSTIFCRDNIRASSNSITLTETFLEIAENRSNLEDECSKTLKE